eukprot:CAMPEP_0205801218 /NCGR_PEP_ID=MMETSP0205-20121125/3148_1 /ASSEMBLY_ACC=CAM_ASM_000278 /TAXON_ID=36767 /ORGANISM="Euplotes focardii, Strain TN1" /LENGTH=51 /DNA_ID=CAMNT_0053065629 /DNA_START=1402 /DNA_END=1557 /DNA_ORIENTATION=+
MGQTIEEMLDLEGFDYNYQDKDFDFNDFEEQELKKNFDQEITQRGKSVKTK